jgi:hypothetical protein
MTAFFVVIKVQEAPETAAIAKGDGVSLTGPMGNAEGTVVDNIKTDVGGGGRFLHISFKEKPSWQLETAQKIIVLKSMRTYAILPSTS